MSDTENTVTATTSTPKPAKPVAPKKATMARSEIDKVIADLPQYDKQSFTVVGHKTGTRLAIPKNKNVSRIYFYGDYSQLPNSPAITVFSEDDRKAKRLGGIVAEIHLDAGFDAAFAALKSLAGAVEKAPVPEAKVAKPKKDKKPAAADETFTPAS